MSCMYYIERSFCLITNKVIGIALPHHPDLRLTPPENGRSGVLVDRLPDMTRHSVLFFVILGSRVDRIVYDNLPPLSVLNSSSIVSPVHCLTLPNQLVFGLPLARAPGVVPWIISFSKHLSFFLIMCPKYISFLFFSDLSRLCLSVRIRII